MTRYTMIIATLCLCLAMACPAWALSVDQVIKLRQAGVSDRLIQKLIQNEIATSRQGGLGRYVVTQEGGRQVIVYEAATPRGVVQYPLDESQGGGVSRMSAALGAPAPKAGHRRAVKAKANSGRYTLHLSSYRNLNLAQKQLAQLKAKGVKARIQRVDLPGKGRWHRILVGNYQTKAAAKAAGEKLSQKAGLVSYRVLRL